MLKQKLYVIAVLICIFMIISCESVSYNPLKIKQDTSIFQAGLTPQKSLNIILTSFRKNDPEIFYYMLAAKVRKDFPYWKIADQWDAIRNNLGEDLLKSKVINVEYLDISPFAPTQTARVVIEYQHPDQGTIVENFLFLLEIAPEFAEKRPSWRLYFPHSEYQENAIWFTLLSGTIVKE